MSLFFTNFVKLDPDPQKMKADPQPCREVSIHYSNVIRCTYITCNWMSVVTCQFFGWDGE